MAFTTWSSRPFSSLQPFYLWIPNKSRYLTCWHELVIKGPVQCQSDFRCATVKMANKVHPIDIETLRTLDIEDNVEQENKGTQTEASSEGKSRQSLIYMNINSYYLLLIWEGKKKETSNPHTVNKALKNGSNSGKLFHHTKSGNALWDVFTL